MNEQDVTDTIIKNMVKEQEASIQILKAGALVIVLLLAVSFFLVKKVCKLQDENNELRTSIRFVTEPEGTK